MSVHFATIYRKDTGQIVETGGFTCEEDFVEMNFAVRVNNWGGADYDSIDSDADSAIHYVIVLAGETIVTDRPSLLINIVDNKTTIAAGTGDSAIFTGLPDPCQIIIDDPDPMVETTIEEVTGGGFEFEAADPGVYTLEVRRFPFLPWKVEITAT